MARYRKRGGGRIRRRLRGPKRYVKRTRSRIRSRFRSRTRTRSRMGSASQVYVVKRQTEVTMYNDTNGATNPYLPCPNSSDGAYLVPTGTDVTTYTAPRHVNFGFSIADKLSALQNISEFDNIFEYVRVSSITRTFVPIFNPSAMVTGAVNDDVGALPNAYSEGGQACPTLLVYPDRDSREPVTAASMREMMGGRRIKMNKPFTDTWVPRISVPVGQTGTGPSQFIGMSKMKWVQFSDAKSIELYGRRYGVIDWPAASGADLPTAVPYAWRIYSTYTFEFKGMK